MQIVARHSGKCLSVNGGSTDDGAAVVQNACGTDLSQQWKLQATGTAYNVIGQGSGKCLDVADKSTANGAALIQWACNGGSNQTWTRST